MKIAIMGAGACGFISAAHCVFLGHDVALFELPEFSDSIRTVKMQGGLTLEACEGTGLPSGFAKIPTITSDAQKALKNAEIVIVAVPFYGEARIAEICAPYLQEGQNVYLSSGYIYGSIEFLKVLRKLGNRAPIDIAEMNNSIYAGFKSGDATVFVGGYKHGLGIAAFPGKRTDSMLRKIQLLYPEIVRFDNLVKTGISNPNVPLHATAMVFNASYADRGDHGEDVYLYHDGAYLAAMSNSIVQVYEAMDAERLKLGWQKEIGVLEPLRIIMKNWYEHQGVFGETLLEIMHNHPGLSEAKLPRSFLHRYIIEDVGAGLYPLIEMLERYHIPCPANKAVAHLALILSGKSLDLKSRTLRSLGLERYSNRDLFEYLYYG